LLALAGTSFLLPRLVGTGNAMMLMMSSEVFLGEEAHRLGLVQRCCDGDVRAQAIAFGQQLADTVSPASLAAIKVNKGRQI
jgi:enoyl-CoA hydratase/carnithine racemase